MSTDTPVVKATRIVKRYGQVTAIDHSDFELRKGEVLAVIGDNGTRKSSIVKAICGATKPDEGKILIDDKPVHFNAPIELGVKESRRVREPIKVVRSRGIPSILISHNMPHVFEVADRIHIHRLGKRLCTVDPKQVSMSDAGALMTGAMKPEDVAA